MIIGAAPGSVVTDYIAVLNQSDFSLPLDVYPSEAINDADGTLSLANRDASEDAGTWLRVGTPHVDVPAQSSSGIGFAVVPITVSIPADAEPGDHVAAVMVSLTTLGQGDENSPSLNFEQRVGARIYITVGGDAKPEITVTIDKVEYDPGPWLGLLGQGRMTVTYTVSNTGNVRFAVQPRTTTAGPFGLFPQHTDGRVVNELLPRGKVTQESTVDGIWPLIRTGVSVVVNPGAAPGSSETLGPVSDTVGVWTIPWLWILILTVVVLIVLRKQILQLIRRLKKRVLRSGDKDETDTADAGPTRDDDRAETPKDGSVESLESAPPDDPVTRTSA